MRANLINSDIENLNLSFTQIETIVLPTPLQTIPSHIDAFATQIHVTESIWIRYHIA